MQPIPGSAEFPNDNPLLHEGAVWICTRVRGAPRAVLRAQAARPKPEPVILAPEPEPVILAVAEPEPEILCVPEPEPAVPEPEPEILAEPEPEILCVPEPEPAVPALAQPESLPSIAAPAEPEPDAFADFMHAVADVLLEAGATRAAAAVPELFEGQRLRDDALGAATLELLVSRGLAEPTSSGVIPSATFVATVDTWRRVLRGEPADLGECGMLDQWAAELVAALAGASVARHDDLRRQLRRRGVAAFGMLARAA